MKTWKRREHVAGKKTIRVALDVLMTVMIVFEMLIQFTGEFLHEVVGFAFFATVLAHILLSIRWVKNTTNMVKSGKIKARRIALAVVGILLAIAVVALGVSSVAISGLLASAGLVWPFGSYATWVFIHTVSAYALCALVVVHLAMHWVFLASAFKVPYDPSRRRAISAGVNAVAAVGVVALGATVAGKTLSLPASQTSVQSGEAAGSKPLADSAVSETSTGQTSDSSSSDSNSSASSNSEPNSSASSNSGKGSRKKSDASSDANGTNENPGTSETAIAGSASGGASDGDAASNPTTEICTLCRKQCPLSSPKCNKPYAAGLL